MNQTFSFSRFSLLVKKHWAENKRRYLLSIPAFMGLLTIWFLFIMLTDGYDPMAKGLQQVTYFFSLFAVGSFYASQFYTDLGSRAKGINYLMVPASSFEKCLCGILYTIVLYFLVFTLSFFFVDALMVVVSNAMHPSYNQTGAGVLENKAGLANVFTAGEFGRNNELNLYFVMLFLAVQSAYMLGSVYFAKYSFVKTAIASFLLVIIFLLISYFFSDSLMPDGGYMGLTSYRVVVKGEQDRLVQLPAGLSHVMRFLAVYSLPPLFWAATYFRLKEKQV